MAKIGIRELRQKASEYLRRVEAGETIEVTDRGRPVALLTPLPDAPPLGRLRAAGEIDEAVGELSELPVPLNLEPDQKSPSSVLVEFRADER